MGVKSIAAADGYSLVVDPHGQVWAFGRNYLGRLGLGVDSQVTDYQPTLITTLPSIISVAVGKNNSFFIDYEGKVWSSGSKQLYGTFDDRYVPEPVNGFGSIIDMTATNSFALYLDQDGKVFIMGPGPLDYTYTLSEEGWSVHQIRGLPFITKMSARNGRYLVVDREGRVWGHGLNTNGMLGFGSLEAVRTLQILREFEGETPIIVDVSLGEYHGLLLDNQGRVWSFGNNDYGQLGLDASRPNSPNTASSVRGGLGDVNPYLESSDSEEEETTNRFIPTLIPGLPPIKSVEAGEKHSLLLDENGDVWYFGDNYNSVYDELNSPQRLENLNNIVEISSFEDHALLTDIYGQIWVFGSNQYSQLGLNYQYSITPYEPVVIPHLVAKIPFEINKLSPIRTDYLTIQKRFDQIVDFTRGEIINPQGDTLIELRDAQDTIYLMQAHYDPVDDQLLPPKVFDDLIGKFGQLIREDQLLEYNLKDWEGYHELHFKDKDGQAYLTLVDYDEPTQQIFPLIV